MNGIQLYSTMNPDFVWGPTMDDKGSEDVKGLTTHFAAFYGTSCRSHCRTNGMECYRRRKVFIQGIMTAKCYIRDVLQEHALPYIKGIPGTVF
ncbi:hypothetical protein BDFB_014321 [Asbolus verrucosus]|uniref:Uncharacterized protein n=1 Tax=Asbolus verrucosus TaxID=1661398 RepID=A0A482W4V1_ASBVE|nr:hypothetical protein BDFB_014321 [Asbolus verrucosus]